MLNGRSILTRFESNYIRESHYIALSTTKYPTVALQIFGDNLCIMLYVYRKGENLNLGEYHFRHPKGKKIGNLFLETRLILVVVIAVALTL